MRGKNVRVRSSEGGEFDCYLATPRAGAKVPAIVIASAVHGVNADVRAIADDFASQGFLAAAPDLFWRSIPGPLARDDDRTKERSQPRLAKIKTGEADLADTLAGLRNEPLWNGRAAVMGLCYGGPYAILGPKRLGYDAGISCHGSQMLDYIGELEGLARPVCIIWGDADHQAPTEVLEAYRGALFRLQGGLGRGRNPQLRERLHRLHAEMPAHDDRSPRRAGLPGSLPARSGRVRTQRQMKGPVCV